MPCRVSGCSEVTVQIVFQPLRRPGYNPGMNQPARSRRGPITLFCESRRFRWSIIAAALMAAAYIVSFGPACWISGRTGFALRALPTVYRPFVMLMAGRIPFASRVYVERPLSTSFPGTVPAAPNRRCRPLRPSPAIRSNSPGTTNHSWTPASLRTVPRSPAISVSVGPG